LTWTQFADEPERGGLRAIEAKEEIMLTRKQYQQAFNMAMEEFKNDPHVGFRKAPTPTHQRPTNTAPGTMDGCMPEIFIW
jgi:hypothetical protein